VRWYLRIPLKANTLMIGLGLLLILATAASGLADAQRDASPFDQVDVPDHSSKGFDPIIVPEAALVEPRSAPTLLPQTSILKGGDSQTISPKSGIPASPPITWQDPAAGPPQTATAMPIWIPDRIVIPAIQLDAPVKLATFKNIKVQGQPYQQWGAPNSFAVGYPTTSAPLGVAGNTVLIGHHNVYGEVFGHLVDLQKGDLILVYSGDKEFAYVIALKMILPEEFQPVEVRLKNAQWIAPSQDERLTLVTCWPYESNTHRLVIVATPVNQGAIDYSEMIPRLTPNPRAPTDTLVSLNSDHAQFVVDVAIPDGTQFAPGTKFTKIWRIRNVGKTTWTRQFILEYTIGAQMALTRQVFFPDEVAPGQTIDLTMEMVAPKTLGDHTSLFQFRNAQGVAFGVGRRFNEAIYSRITVIAGPPANP
jgi:LPXTG-site transpeptidase (sortase) family protein